MKAIQCRCERVDARGSRFETNLNMLAEPDAQSNLRQCHTCEGLFRVNYLFITDQWFIAPATDRDLQCARDYLEWSDRWFKERISERKA